MAAKDQMRPAQRVVLGNSQDDRTVLENLFLTVPRPTPHLQVCVCKIFVKSDCLLGHTGRSVARFPREGAGALHQTPKRVRVRVRVPAEARVGCCIVKAVCSLPVLSSPRRSFHGQGSFSQ